MAAPKHTPVDPVDRPRAYRSPDHVPGAWREARPASLEGPQPRGGRLGHQGPDQGFALALAERLRPRIVPQSGEDVDDAIAGCVAIAMRRASRYGRAPVIHDLLVAFGIWGWFLVVPPADLVARRRAAFAGLSHATISYERVRALADAVPDTTMMMTPAQVDAGMPGSWAALTGS